MLRYLARRILWAAVLFFLIPANPAQLVAGKAATPADIKRAEHFIGTDRPIYVQYGKFLWRIVAHHNLGHSFANRQSVNGLVGNAAPVTASLVFGGAFFLVVVLVPVGILSALRPRSIMD